MARATLQTIADRVGVSRMTVSNAFSRPDQLSAELRERILAVADELGYVGPNPTARALASGAAGSVGLVLSDNLSYALTDGVANALLSAITDELAPTGIALTLLSDAPRGTIIPARDVAMDGAFIYSCDPGSTAVDWLTKRQLPLVFIDQAPAAGIASVNVDDRGGARAAAQHLVELGHRRVAIVTTGYGGEFGVVPEALRSTAAHTERQRLHGWLDALTPAGIEPVVVRLPNADPVEVGQVAARQLLELEGPRPTAVLCFSDAVAIGVVRTLQESGLRVPADVSVVGFDDNPGLQWVQPALTTVRQDVTAKGRAAAVALTAAIARAKAQTTGRARHLLLPTELVVRDSTARPPA